MNRAICNANQPSAVCRALLCGLLFALLASGPTRANDSSASLAAGGLRLTLSPHIRLDREDLTLSRAQVRVVYRFRNVSAHDIGTLVAFPLPAMEIAPSGNYAAPGRGEENLMDFRVSADGHPVAVKTQMKATRLGLDVTGLLKRYKIPLSMTPPNGDAAALEKRLDSLPAAAKAELARFGVMEWIAHLGANARPIAIPHWMLHITYYWFQTFPARTTIEITHRYRPLPRAIFLHAGDLASDDMRRAYCIHPRFARRAIRLARQAPDGLLEGHALDYVLTTAGNWLGPIGLFHLTVKTASPGSLASFCASGIRALGPSTLVVWRKDFEPKRNLKVLFVGPLDGRGD